MRSRFWVLLLMVCCVAWFAYGVVMAQPKHPEPFQKAKEMALACPVNENGDHQWSAVINKDGQSSEYYILYRNFKDARGEEHDVVLLIKKQGPLWRILGHCGICDDYRTASHQSGGYRSVDKEMAIQAAYDFFKELLNEKSI